MADDPASRNLFVDSNFRGEPQLVLGFAIFSGAVDDAEYIIDGIGGCRELVDSDPRDPPQESEFCRSDTADSALVVDDTGHCEEVVDGDPREDSQLALGCGSTLGIDEFGHHINTSGEIIVDFGLVIGGCFRHLEILKHLPQASSY